MMYTRASASDYDAWKTVHENPGWGSDDLVPLLKKVREMCPFYPSSLLISSFSFFGHLQTVTYQVAGGEPTHGSDGPLKVSLGVTTSEFGDQYLQVAAAFDPSRSRAQPYTDPNDLSTVNVYTVCVVLSP
jgi:alcohol oxidase